MSSNATMREDITREAAGLLDKLTDGIRNLFKQEPNDPRDPAQFGTYLPYRAFDDSHDFFVLKHGLGFVLEVTPQTGASQTEEKLLESIMSGWPTGTSIQIQLFGSPHIESHLKRYANLRKVDEDSATEANEWGRAARNTNLYRQLARRRYDYLKAASFKSITKGNSYLLRTIRLVISVSIPCDPNNALSKRTLANKREQLQAGLSAANYSSVVWSAEDMVNFTAGLTNPHRLFEEPQHINYDPGRDMRDQIVDIDTRQLAHPTHITFTKPNRDTEVEARVYAVRTYPKRFALYMMGGLIGNLLQSNLQYPCPYVITMGVVILDPATTSAWVSANQARSTQNAETKMAKYMPDIPAKKQDWDEAKSAADNGANFVKLYHTLTLFADPDTMMRAEQTADSIWKGEGFTINNVAFIHRPALLASLPLGLSPDLEKDLYQLRISSTKTVQNAVALAPLLGEWRGTRTPAMLFTGRRGQPTSFDLYDSIGNYNAAITGTSGAGKSSTIAEIAWSYLGTGAKVWILDLGRTFYKLCMKADGAFLEFNSKCGININPFTHVVDFQDDYAMLQAVLIKMASPDRDLADPFQRQALGDALTQVWAVEGTRTTVSHIRDRLATGRLRDNEEPDRRLTDLAMMLSPYAKGGAYENFFDGPCNIDLTNPLTVIEFEELKRSPALHHVTTLILLFRITSEMYFDRSKRKLFIVDELKQQLGADQDPTLVTIIEEAARRARKYGGSLITATQEVEDYYASDALKTAFSLADHKFILRQSKESLALLMKNDKLAIDDNRKRLLESMTMVQGAYTEFYLYTPDSSGLLRLPLDPYAQLLFSNRIEDNAPLEEKRQRGLNIDEAIAELIHERGGRAA